MRCPGGSENTPSSKVTGSDTLPNKRYDVSASCEICLAASSSSEQRANLGGEHESVRRLHVIQRFDAQRIPREKKQWRRRVTFAQIEQREREHPAQFGQAILAPFFPRVHQNFSIRIAWQIGGPAK